MSMNVNEDKKDQNSCEVGAGARAKAWQQIRERLHEICGKSGKKVGLSYDLFYRVSKIRAAWSNFCLRHPLLRLMRLDRPVPLLLLFAPIYWNIQAGVQGLAGGGNGLALTYYSLVFGVGAVLARSAGCIANDIWDRRVDALTARTKQRPLASGEVSVTTALILLAALGSAAAVLVWLCLPLQVAIWGSCLVALGIAIYPLAKRVTMYPQIVLGFVFNLGGPLAWWTIIGTIHHIPILLYFAAVLWTIGYDMIYAHQDYEDDLQNNSGSMVLVFRERCSDVVWNLYRASGLMFLLAGMQTYGLVLPFYALSAVAIYLLHWQCMSFEFTDPQASGRLFRSNGFYAILTVLACILGGMG